jgi:hypothetical protein
MELYLYSPTRLHGVRQPHTTKRRNSGQWAKEIFTLQITEFFRYVSFSSYKSVLFSEGDSRPAP